MFHIDGAFRAQGRQVGAANVCMERSERLSENGFIRSAAPPSVAVGEIGSQISEPSSEVMAPPLRAIPMRDEHHNLHGQPDPEQQSHADDRVSNQPYRIPPRHETVVCLPPGSTHRVGRIVNSIAEAWASAK